MSKINFQHAARIKWSGGELLRWKGPGFSWTRPGVGAFNPDSLFVGNVGWIYDVSDLSTMFQDIAGTVPVTGAGQRVGLHLDLSGNSIHRFAVTDEGRPTIEVDENGDFYLVSTDSGQQLVTNAHVWGSGRATVCIGLQRTLTGATGIMSRSPNIGANTGVFAINQRNLSGRQTFQFQNKGTNLRSTDAGGTFAVPDRFAITLEGNLTAPFTRGRINGVEVVNSTSSLNGAYGEDANFFPINARDYGSVGINRLLIEAELLNLEAWIAARFTV